MLKLQKSSLILILIIVVLTAGCVSIYTLGYTPGTVWHKAEDVKSGTFGQNVNTTNKDYVFPANLEVGSGQVTAGSGFVTGGSSLTGTALTVASGGVSSIGGDINITGNVGIGTISPGSHKVNINGTLNATEIYENGVPLASKYGGFTETNCEWTPPQWDAMGNTQICPEGKVVRGVRNGQANIGGSCGGGRLYVVEHMHTNIVL